MSSLLKPKTIEAFHTVRQLVAEESSSRSSQPGDDVTVTPLGTSSAMPSKYRNGEARIVWNCKALRQCVYSQLAVSSNPWFRKHIA